MKKIFIATMMMTSFMCACAADVPDDTKAGQPDVYVTGTAPDDDTQDIRDSEPAEPDRDNGITVSDNTAEDAGEPDVPDAAETDKKDTDMPDVKETGNTPIDVEPATGGYAKGRELFCLADSETEAASLASLYGITLVDYSYGVATFTTAEDPSAVVKRGRDNGWKAIEINYIRTIQ